MFGLYIHIPFCIRKCRYCDFNSRAAVSGETDDYLSALIEEVKLFSRSNRRIVETLYIGGGTPTLLSNEQISRLFGAVRESMTLFEDAEITVEANPGTLDPAKAVHLLGLGVNRISLGVQSLKDSLLSRLGRVHTGTEALNTLEMLRSSGFSNIGVDLIFGLPGQTHNDWEEDLTRIVSFQPQHLSLYGLSIEKGTPFDMERKQGTLKLPSEQEEIGMYEAAKDLTAKAGYERYEISNYAQPDYRSRHNTIYWTMEEYYGAGAGAHSYLKMDGPLRFSNVSDPAAYIQRMSRTRDPVAKREFLSKETLLSEAMMLGLRMAEGVDIRRFQQTYGEDPVHLFSESMQKGIQSHWVEVTAERIRLTASGVLFSNEVFVDLFG